jgi:hypothetical protein
VVKEDRASHGRAFFGPDMTCGTVITTLNRADNVISKRFGNVGWMCPVVRRNET